jgi:hypothetical protein
MIATMRAALFLTLTVAVGCASAQGAEPVRQIERAGLSAERAPWPAPIVPSRDDVTRARALLATMPAAACPSEMARVGASCIDRWEAHLLTLGNDGRLLRHPHHLRPPEFWFVAASAAGVPPQGYISRRESALACEAADKRLCSHREWRRACTGSAGRRYPYGWSGQRGTCNVGKDHLLFAKYGKGPWEYDAHFNSPALNQEPGFLEPSGTHDRCVSPEGVHDLVGNLHEWVAGTVTESFVAEMEDEPVSRREQPWVEGNGIFMGGFYSTLDQLGPGCFYTTIAHEPTYHDYSTGFRCCKDAE